MNATQTMPLPTSCPRPEKWSAFYLGQLPEEDVQALAAHLDQCPTCSSSLPALDGQTDPLLLERQPLEDDPYISEPACGEALARVRELVSQPSTQAAAVSLSVPLQLGPYRLVRKLGEGSMGTVFQAIHERLDRVVALKTLSGRRLGEANAVARFRREIEAVSRLDHPHIIRATDAGEVDGILYLVMDLVEGIDLAHLLKQRGPLPVADACELVRQAALGLEHAHAHGLVHRDIKPSNLLLGRNGQVKVLDLGLALPPADRPDEEALTSTGHILGTFDYMAPEQCRDTHAVDARADIYSLGCTLYHLLTGHVPFADARYLTPQSKLWAHAFEMPPPLRQERPEVSQELSAVVERLLAKDPAARCGTAAEAATTLAPFAVGCNAAALLEGLDLTSAPLAGSEPGDAVPRRPATLARTLFPATSLILLTGVMLAAALALSRPAAIPPGGDPPASEPDLPAKQEQSLPPPAPQAPPPVYPMALLGFEERGTAVFGLGSRVDDLLFARLGVSDRLILVDRQDLGRALAEAELNLAAATQSGNAFQVGCLTGARLLVTGSVVPLAGKKICLVAKIIGSETSRVIGAEVKGSSDDLDGLVAQLADKVADAIARRGDSLVAKSVPRTDRLRELRERLKGRSLPLTSVRITERHIGAATSDPAAQTEVTLYCREAGFKLLDAEDGKDALVDVRITGEGVSELAARRGGLVSVTARLEVKAVERRTGRLLAVDRQTVVVVGLAEHLVGKAALQEAAAAIAVRLLPRLVKE